MNSCLKIFNYYGNASTILIASHAPEETADISYYSNTVVATTGRTGVFIVVQVSSQLRDQVQK